jgi:hypothetical protein
MWVFIAVAAIITLIVATGGTLISTVAVDAAANEAVDARVISPDDAEPFVICMTTRAGVTKCKDLDLLAGYR